ncbi:hypothetical protein BH11ACT6_BH11ACT6_03700 [soil metagenome]
MSQEECIPLYTPGWSITCETTAAVSAKTFVGLTGAMAGGLPKVATATAGSRPWGVAATDAPSGGRVMTYRGPSGALVLPVIAGAAITAGTPLEVGSFGRVVPRTTGVKVGMALDTVAGADVEIFIELH